ncbi:sodium:solute symporter family transporter [Cyclobacterium jeungdonense]|uniref:Sodium/solute symporter n=1 Tax=Cyclobacterium jeungdonense TaxID=708087 RepID=A0ABT8C5I2_9BACT|nr:sodium/solute symporter [Cyclobacterium jeungdonense]MDN3687048.1 sodium/solute symporter [Cyclobacterium jeungdonense]
MIPIKPLLTIAFFLMSVWVTSLSAKEIQWKELPSIPDKEGYAGMFAGVSNGVLVVAGGANFPNKRPWEGGEKIWYDHIYLLENKDEVWQLAEQRLPQPLAYGVSVTFNNKIWVIGGNDAQGHYDKVYSISYQAGEIVIDVNYPSLPVALANMAGAVVDGVVYIQGGQVSPGGVGEDSFYILDLKQPPSEMKWVGGPAFPGTSRIQAVAAGHNGEFYVFSGFHLLKNEDGGLDRQLLIDAYRYSPGDSSVNGKWEQLEDLPRGVAAAPSPAFSMGNSHILIPGGLDEETLRFTDPSTHPGFSDKMLAYHSKAETWVEMGDMPDGISRVTAPTAFWKGYWIVPNGEKGPGVRSPKVMGMETKNAFGWANWTTLGIYLCGMLGIGFYFSKRENTTDEYFLAGGRIPWWAAGLSIYGTQLSAITFMAIPVIVYATNWRLALGSFMIFAIVPIIIKYYLPFFRRLNITTAYQYLELRFNIHVRLLGSVTFIMLQLARMGVVVYLPAIAISSVTGMDILLCIGIMGLFSTVYTVMGGMEAVIWTDVIQVLVLLGGALLSIFIAIANIEGGLGTIFQVATEHQKFKLIDWSWDYTQLVFWVAIIGFFFLNLISYTSDQVVIQRYLTVKNEDEAAKSLWTNGIITLPGILLFFGLGTVLYVFYYSNPDKIGSVNPEELLPYYIVAELPVGIAGLVIAGIFAASMSSLDSSMNSISTAYITDIHKFFNAKLGDREYLKLAKITTVVMGVFGTLTAMWIAVSEVGFIFDLFQKLLGMIGGSLAGVFVLAIFSQKANATGVIIGTISGAFCTFLVSRFTDINGYLYGAIGVLSCVLIGYTFSLLFPKGKSQPQGFTYKSIVKK